MLNEFYHIDLPLYFLLLVAKFSHHIVCGLACLGCDSIHHPDAVSLIFYLSIDVYLSVPGSHLINYEMSKIKL
jgi:hypothetical protein